MVMQVFLAFLLHIIVNYILSCHHIIQIEQNCLFNLGSSIPPPAQGARDGDV